MLISQTNTGTGAEEPLKWAGAGQGIKKAGQRLCGALPGYRIWRLSKCCRSP